MLEALALLDRPAPPPVEPGWTRVCALRDLEPLWGEAALLGADQVAVFLLPDGRLFAVSNTDPVTGSAVLSRGIVGSKAGRPTIASPLHKDLYDLETGDCLTNPRLRVTPWRIRTVDGQVEIARPAALIGASHGTSDPAGRRAVTGLTDAIAKARPDLDVLPCFVDVQEPDVPRTLGALDPTRAATIVPLLLSTGYHVRVDLAEAAAGARPRTATVTPALGPDPRLAAVLRRRLEHAGYRPGDRVVLGAAGSSDPDAIADCRRAADQLAHLIGADVATGFISAARPRLSDAVAAERAAHPDARIVVSTYLLAPGYFAQLAERSGADLVTAPLLVDGEEPAEELVAVVTDRYAGLPPS